MFNLNFLFILIIFMIVLDTLFDSTLKTGNFECHWQAKGWFLGCFSFLWAKNIHNLCSIVRSHVFNWPFLEKNQYVLFCCRSFNLLQSNEATLALSLVLLLSSSPLPLYFSKIKGWFPFFNFWRGANPVGPYLYPFPNSAGQI